MPETNEPTASDTVSAETQAPPDAGATEAQTDTQTPPGADAQTQTDPEPPTHEPPSEGGDETKDASERETEDALPGVDSEPEVEVVDEQPAVEAPPAPPPQNRTPPLAAYSHRPGFAPPPAAPQHVMPATPLKPAGGMRSGNVLPVAPRIGGATPPPKATR